TSFVSRSNAASAAGCQSGFDASINTGGTPLVLLISIYDAVTQSGSNFNFHEVDFVGFVITGYHWGTSYDNERFSSPTHCTGTDYCVYGYFTSKSGTQGGTKLNNDYDSIVRTVG